MHPPASALPLEPMYSASDEMMADSRVLSMDDKMADATAAYLVLSMVDRMADWKAVWMVVATALTMAD